MGILDNPAPSPAVGAFLAQQLVLLREGTNPSLIGANILADTGRFNSQGDIPSSGFYPRGWWVRDSVKTWLFISGAEDFGQASRYVEWVSFPTQGGVVGQLNRNYLLDANEHYLTPIQGPDVGQSGTFVVTGHSLGGMFAQSLLLASAVRNIRTARAAVTFGSPKVAFHSDNQSWVGHNVTRWMVNGDPIPQIPPTVVQNIASWASIGPGGLQNWALFYQIAGGVVMNANGLTLDAPVPPVGAVEFGASLANWLWNIYNGRATVHDLPEYVARLEAVNALVIPPMSAEVVVSGPEPRVSLDRRNANRQIDAAVQTIIHSSQVQNAARLGVPPQAAFKPFKIGGIWWVVFGGVLIAAGPRHKPCSILATRGNQFLRRLQRMGGVDGNSLARLLGEYIDAASEEGGQFSPPIARLD